jgi:hypothetical protein
MEELSKEDTAEMMSFWYEEAVDEQRAELRQYKKKAKAQIQLPHVEPVPLTIENVEEDLPQGQGERPEPIKA